MSDNSKEIRCYIDKTDYNLFQAIFNATGVRNSPWLAGRLLLKGLELELLRLEIAPKELKDKWDGLPEEIKAVVKLEKLHFLKRRQDEYQMSLNLLAVRDLSPEEAEELGEVARVLDLNEDAAASFAATFPFGSVVQHVNTSTAMGRCIQWLSQTFSENLEIPIQEVLTRSGEQGFSEVTTKRAKRKLGIGHGKRKGDGVWCWYAPTIEVTVDGDRKSRLSHLKLNETTTGGVFDDE